MLKLLLLFNYSWITNTKKPMSSLTLAFFILIHRKDNNGIERDLRAARFFEVLSC